MLQVNVAKRLAVAVAFAVTVCCGELAASAVCVNVNDYAGLPLHNAWVTATDLQANELFNTRTDRKGGACVSEIPEGLYSVEVGLTGFLNVRYYPVRVTSMATQELKFSLPFAEITEGGIANEAVLSGTLKEADVAIGGARMCVLSLDRDLPITCTVTNDLGEYAVSVPPGTYRVEVKAPGEAAQQSRIEIPAPGIYRNRISLQTRKEARH
jgi:hypothetical protein